MEKIYILSKLVTNDGLVFKYFNLKYFIRFSLEENGKIYKFRRYSLTGD